MADVIPINTGSEHDREGSFSNVTMANVSLGGGGGSDGSGGDDDMDRGYIDAKIDAAKAENDAAVTRLEAKIDAAVARLGAKIDAIKPPTVWQMAGVAGATLGLAFAILAYASDRFDGGLSAGAIVDSIVREQNARDSRQDQKLDLILDKMERLSQSTADRPTEGD